MQKRPLPPDLWRSILFVPASNSKFVRKALGTGADAVQLDLEDGLGQDAKQCGRAAVAEHARVLRDAGFGVSVRVNRPLDLAVRDIEASVCQHVQVLALPKVIGASHVKLIDELVGSCERRVGLPVGRTRFIVAVETAEAFSKLVDIARSSPRILGMMLGGEDFAAECRCEPSEDVMRGYKQQMIVAARAAGIRPLGLLGSIANFRELDQFEEMVQRSRASGYEGATCIHPNQIVVLNRQFSIADSEFEWAQRILRSANSEELAGVGAFSLDGKMVDKPVIERAKQLVYLAENYRMAGK